MSAQPPSLMNQQNIWNMPISQWNDGEYDLNHDSIDNMCKNNIRQVESLINDD
jgi:hypothetical protein